MTKRLMFLFGLLGLTVQGCSQPAQVAAVSPQTLPAGWSCATGLTATRSNGATAIYTGADARDPGFCLGTLNGQPNNGYLGILPGSGGTAEARSAIARVVAGPPGTAVGFTGDHGEPWTIKVVDRSDYVIDGKSYPAIHYSYSTPHVGANEVWMDAHNGMFFGRRGGPRRGRSLGSSQADHMRGSGPSAVRAGSGLLPRFRACEDVAVRG